MEDYISTRRAAEILGMTPEGVRAMIRRGALRRCKRMRGWRYLVSLEEVEQLVALADVVIVKGGYSDRER